MRSVRPVQERALRVHRRRCGRLGNIRGCLTSSNIGNDCIDCLASHGARHIVRVLSVSKRCDVARNSGSIAAGCWRSSANEINQFRAFIGGVDNSIPSLKLRSSSRSNTGAFSDRGGAGGASCSVRITCECSVRTGDIFAWRSSRANKVCKILQRLSGDFSIPGLRHGSCTMPRRY
jgi:hypothetical protein